MRPVDQTTFGSKDAEPAAARGDCLRACICSLFHLDPADVPHFAASETWPHDLQEWLGRRGLTYVPLGIAEEDEPAVPRIRCGPSPRGDWSHAVAVDADGTVHDPHPSRAGLDEREGERWLMLFLPLDLAEVRPVDAPGFAACHARP